MLQTSDFPVEGSIKIAWMVGPEGGFDENELTMLDAAGTGITLGNYIFRLENAALAGVVFLQTAARAAAAKQEQI